MTLNIILSYYTIYCIIDIKNKTYNNNYYNSISGHVLRSHAHLLLNIRKL